MGSNSLMLERIGQKGMNKLGSVMEVVAYKDANDIWVKFIENGNLVHAQWKHFCKGLIKNPFDKSVWGVGIIGIGEYTVSENGKFTPQYYTWSRMIQRCYDSNYHKRQPTYLNCTVADEWHYFQTFAKWYDQNYYQIDGQRMSLDKDILVKGNKQYSPDTCIFVPQKINNIFLKKESKRGKFPIGVTANLKNKCYNVRCSDNIGKNRHVGSYKTPEEAFQVYKLTKETFIKEVAEEYRNLIPSKLYEVLLNYEVEITD